MPLSLPRTPTSLPPHTPSWKPIQTPMQPSTHSNPSPPHHPLLPHPAPDPFLSTPSPELLQSLVLHSWPPGAASSNPVTPRAVTTGSSFAPAHPASVPPSPLALPVALVPPVTNPSQHQPLLSPPVPARQQRALPPALLAAWITSAVRSPGVTSGVTLDRTVPAPPVAGAGREQQQQPMEISREATGPWDSLQALSAAGSEPVLWTGAAVPSLGVHSYMESVPPASIPPYQQQQKQQQLLTSQPSLGQQQEAGALAGQSLQGEGAGGNDEDELAQLEQLRQLLLLQEQLIRKQPEGGEGLQRRRQRLEGMKCVEWCGDLNQQVETEGGVATERERQCRSEE
ncbi:unnamed protein product [Closterium sp. Naga37s-1]|nr:unnamed protein product [Closterium sp. Naga37s-1]